MENTSDNVYAQLRELCPEVIEIIPSHFIFDTSNKKLMDFILEENRSLGRKIVDIGTVAVNPSLVSNPRIVFRYFNGEKLLTRGELLDWFGVGSEQKTMESVVNVLVNTVRNTALLSLAKEQGAERFLTQFQPGEGFLPYYVKGGPGIYVPNELSDGSRKWELLDFPRSQSALDKLSYFMFCNVMKSSNLEALKSDFVFQYNQENAMAFQHVRAGEKKKRFYADAEAARSRLGIPSLK